MTALQLVRLGTRASRLARAQTAWVADRLAGVAPHVKVAIEVIVTEGDRDRVTPLQQMGGSGVFTDALERSLREGNIDVAVHSLKDLPVESTDDVVIAAVCGREDARDVLVARDGLVLATLPRDAHVGTCSTRRTAQLLAARPDLRVGALRGNVDTRIRRVAVGEFDAILLAAAGLHRLSLQTVISEYLPLHDFLPAPGQGALAVQCRSSDIDTRRLIEALDDLDARWATTAERAFLGALGGGCAAPVAAFARVERDIDGERLVMHGLVASRDGGSLVRVHGSAAASAPAALGAQLAEAALARGAHTLLVA